MRAFKDAGVNRCSIGIQSFDDKVLRWMNRSHSGSDAIKAVNVATKIFNRGVTFDLIYGIPNQTPQLLKEQLKLALNLSDSHFSSYQLTVEYGTSLYKQVHEKTVVMPDPDTMADMYELILEIARSRGLDRYEVSNYAKGAENEGVHNKQYWNGSDYLGIGPGAHSRLLVADGISRSGPRLCKESQINIRDPKTYMLSVFQRGHGIAKSQVLSENESLNELVVFGLRTKYGVSNESFKKIGDGSHTLDAYLLLENVEDYICRGFLKWIAGPYSKPKSESEIGIESESEPEPENINKRYALAPTPKGMMVIDSIIADIIP